jgi:hypothetical protein
MTVKYTSKNGMKFGTGILKLPISTPDRSKENQGCREGWSRGPGG